MTSTTQPPSEELRQPSQDQTTLAPRDQFFGLPGEIRNRIYRQLFKGVKLGVLSIAADLDYSGPYAVGYMHAGSSNVRKNRSLGLNILFVAKQVYAEAKTTLMDMIVIDYIGSFHTSGSASLLHAKDLRLIRSLEHTMWVGEPGIHILAIMTSLRSVHWNASYLINSSVTATKGPCWEEHVRAKCFQMLTKLPKRCKTIRNACEILINNATRRGETGGLNFYITFSLKLIDYGSACVDYDGTFWYEAVLQMAWTEANGRISTPKLKMELPQ